MTLGGADSAVDLTTLRARERPRRAAAGRLLGRKDHRVRRAQRRASDPLAIYTMNADGTGCAKQPDIAGHPAMGNGLLEHDFDPAFSPPGATASSASSSPRRAGTSTRAAPPSTTPARSARPRTRRSRTRTSTSSSRTRARAGKTRVRQLTWQLNMERLPSFMQDGRLVFTTEKRAPGFYQLALRRQNLDGGDYHPLFAQRGSIGYQQATYVVELADKNFAAIFSNHERRARRRARSASSTARSASTSRAPTAGDYPVDPTVINPARRRRRRATSSCTRSRVAAERRLVHEPGAAARRQDARELRHAATRRPSAATTTSTCSIRSPAPRRSCSAARGPPRSRPSRCIRADRQGHLRVDARRAERAHVHRPGRTRPERRRHHRARHAGARVAALPEHAHRPRGRAGPRELRDLRGPPARRDRASPAAAATLRATLRQGLRAAAPPRHGARAGRRLGALPHPRRAADGAAPPRRQRVHSS